MLVPIMGGLRPDIAGGLDYHFDKCIEACKDMERKQSPIGIVMVAIHTVAFQMGNGFRRQRPGGW
jgi:hypothetical protein